MNMSLSMQTVLLDLAAFQIYNLIVLDQHTAKTEIFTFLILLCWFENVMFETSKLKKTKCSNIGSAQS